MDESSSSINTENALHSKETSSTLSHEGTQISQEQRDHIITSIANNLTELIIENHQNIKRRYIKRDSFYLTHIPFITLEDYLKRIIKYTRMDISTLILAIIYIDKMCETQEYILSFNNIHRLILAACLISIKFNEDVQITNSYYAKIGCVSVELLNKLEYDFYISLKFNLVVDYFYYQKYFAYFSKYNNNKIVSFQDNRTLKCYYEC